MYDRIRGASNIPVYDGFGGHDGNCHNPRSTVNYEQRIGPAWYSWDYGGVHFIQFVTETHYLRSEAKARQDKWLAADLRTLPRGTPVIVATHYPLRSEWFDQRKKEGINILCHLAAHWHVVQKGSRCGVPVLISAPARGNDWGAYSRAYRWISVTPEGLKSELRIAGQYRRLRIFSPAPQSPLGLRPMMLLAYDSARSVRSVTCRVTSPNGRSLLPKLLRSGDYSWLGEIDFDVPGV